MTVGQQSNGTSNGTSNGSHPGTFYDIADTVGFDHVLTLHTATNGSNGSNKFFQDYGIWQNAPVLTGSTKFEASPDVKNIMITGGAGFM